MATLGPCGIVVGLQVICLLVTAHLLFLTTLLGPLVASVTIYDDAERRQFLAGDELVSHHVGSADLKPALDGVVLAGHQHDLEFSFALSRTIPGCLGIQVVAHNAVLHLRHIGVVEGGSGVAADAGLEALRGGEVHVLRIGHRRAVHDIVIGEGLVDVLVQHRTPDAVAVTLHGLGLRQDLCCQQHLLGFGGLHAEDDVIVVIFRRDDGLGEESCHHTRRELCLFSCCGLRGLGVLHRLCRCLGVEEQGQGLREEVFGVHPRVTELIVGVFLHAGDAMLVEKFHIVAGIAVEEVIRAHAEPEQTDLAVRVLGVVIDVGQGGGSKRAVAAQVGKLVEMRQSIGECLVTTTRETADGTMVGIVDGAVVTFDIRHQVVVEVEAEHIPAEHGLRCT